MGPVEFIFLVAVAAFTLTAAVSDARTRRVPNWLTVPTFALAVVVHAVANGVAGLGFALAGFATGFGILLILWLIGGGGGGDVKMMGALGAWLGTALILRVFFVSTALIILAIGAGFIVTSVSTGFGNVYRRIWRSRPSRRQYSAGPQGRNRRSEQSERRRLLPFAVPVAVGTWLVLVGAWLRTGYPFTPF